MAPRPIAPSGIKTGGPIVSTGRLPQSFDPLMSPTPPASGPGSNGVEESSVSYVYKTFNDDGSVSTEKKVDVPTLEYTGNDDSTADAIDPGAPPKADLVTDLAQAWKGFKDGLPSLPQLGVGLGLVAVIAIAGVLLFYGPEIKAVTKKLT